MIRAMVQSAATTDPPATLRFNNRDIVEFRATILGRTPAMRAALVGRVLRDLASQRQAVVVSARQIEQSMVISVGSLDLLALVPLDAAALGESLEETARRAASTLQIALDESVELRYSQPDGGGRRLEPARDGASRARPPPREARSPCAGGQHRDDGGPSDTETAGRRGRPRVADSRAPENPHHGHRGWTEPLFRLRLADHRPQSLSVLAAVGPGASRLPAGADLVARSGHPCGRSEPVFGDADRDRDAVCREACGTLVRRGRERPRPGSVALPRDGADDAAPHHGARSGCSPSPRRTPIFPPATPTRSRASACSSA